VAKAPPDGYTILVGTSSTHAIAPSLYTKLPYDAVKDFTPVAGLATSTITLSAHPSVPARNVKELIALAKAKPDMLSFASSGAGGVSHLVGEMFKSQAGIQMLHVPYKGDAPALADLVGGQVSLEFGTAVAFLPYIQSGKLRALAVTATTRSALVPDLPTLDEAGVKGYDLVGWNGLFVPAGTAGAIVTKLHQETVKALAQPELKARLATLGAEGVGSSPQEFGAFVKAEVQKWSRVAKEAGLKAE
jgi:tripartite-type tricarboxylate transporter receptor subunit TctC